MMIRVTAKTIFLLFALNAAMPNKASAMEACLDLEAIELPDSCDKQEIMTVIQEEWRNAGGRKGCGHNQKTEAMLLADMPTLQQAKVALQNYCLGVEPCIKELINLEVEECTFQNIVDEVQNTLDDLEETCEHDGAKELEIMLAEKSARKTRNTINGMCAQAWEREVDTHLFMDIDSRFDDAFMDDYVAGDTFLNKDTGSFGGTVEGNNIQNFHDNQAKNGQLYGFPALEECNFNSIMCCFGRDRQPNDDNGNCATEDCVDADPADNSNLCYTDYDETPFPGATEGDIHCHGLAWADADTESTALLKYNNFFYVSLYDHMYKRGYVEDMIDSETVPMCGCIEDMSPVSRADCTQVDVNTVYTITLGEYNPPEITLDNADELEIEYNACQGTNPKNGNAQDNDLASYVYRLNKEGRLSKKSKREIFDVLVGYRQPGDNDNERACAAAYEDETGLEYPTEA